MATFFCGLSIAGVRTEQTPSAVYSAGELREMLLDTYQRVESFYVVYRSGDMSKKDPSYPAGSYLHRVVAAKAPHLFRHVNAHGHDNLDWRDDPQQQRLFVGPEFAVNFNPVNRTVWQWEIQPTDDLPSTMEFEFFFVATGVWPMTSRPSPLNDGEPYVLVDVARCEAYSVVRPYQENVDGRWSHVLDRPGGGDTLWLDTDRNCALMAREIYESKTGAVMQRVELAEHREVAPGVWLPMQLRNIQYNYQAANPAARSKVWKDAVLEVKTLEVNNVKDEVFDVDIPAGTLLLNKKDPPVQITAGGLDLLDDLEVWIRKHCLDEKESQAGSRWILGALCAAMAVIAVWEVNIRRSTDAAPAAATDSNTNNRQD